MVKSIIRNAINKVVSQSLNKNGIVLGKGQNILSGDDCVVTIPWAVANRHTYLLGATGSGKTTLLRNVAYQIVKANHGIMFIDMKGGKGAEEVVKDLWLACIENKREKDFVFISPIELLGLKTNTWNPCERGDASVIANKIFDALKNISSNAQFYEDVKFDILLKLVIAAKKRKKPFTLKTLAQALTSLGDLEKFAESIPYGEERDMIFQLVEEWEANKMQFVKNIKGTLVSLQMLSMSYPAKILETTSPTFDLFEAVEKQKVVYMLLPTLLAKESMRQVAKMFLSELKTVAGEFLTSGKRSKFFVLIDEFEEMVFPGVKDLFNKAREAGISMLIGHQTVADVDYEAGESYARSLMDNTATKIFMQMKSHQSAELAADTIGKLQKLPFISKWMDVKHIVPPEIFMGQNALYDAGLKVGEAVVKVDAHIYRVTIPYPKRRDNIRIGIDIPLPS